MTLAPARDHPCLMCGRPASNWHERLPRGRGGPRDSFNAVPLCGSGTTGCHGFVTEHPAWARARRLTIPGRMIRGRYDGPDPVYRWWYGAWAPVATTQGAGHVRRG